MDLKPLRTGTFLACLVVIAIGIFIRFQQLDLRPLHHDESIHVEFGRGYYDHPETNFYKYDPEYHGPLLYTMLRVVYAVFGVTEQTARGMVAFLGSCLLFLPFLCRRHLSERAVLITTIAFSFSPTLIFWSRFVREDIFVFTGMGLALYGILAAPTPLKSALVFVGIVFQYASKENSYVTLALLWAYFVFEFCWRRFIEKKQEPVPFTLFSPIPFALVVVLRLGGTVVGDAYKMISYEPMHIGAIAGVGLIAADIFRKVWDQEGEDNSLIVRLLRFIHLNQDSFFIGLTVGAFIFCYLFGGGLTPSGNWVGLHWFKLRYPQGILDGLYQKGITYWLEKHNIERIKGPFLFHFYMLSWYEFFFMLSVFVHAVHFSLTHGKLIRWLSQTVLISALLIGFLHIPHDAFGWQEPTFPLWKMFKLKDWFDIVGFLLLVSYPAIVTLGHCIKREWNLCFWGYWFTGTLFTYSYLGEKVPWLSAYPILAGLCYFPIYWMNAFSRDTIEKEIGAVVLTFSKIIAFITIIFVPIYYFITKEPSSSIWFTYPQLLPQGALCLGFSLVLFLIYKLHERVRFLSRPMIIGGIFLVYLCFTLRIAYMVNFIPEKFERGYISQVHTTTEIVTLAKNARKEAEKPGGATSHSISLAGDAAWPLVWYFRYMEGPAYVFNPNGENKEKYFYLFQDTKESTPDTFNRREVGLRGWWVPDFKEMTVLRFLKMSVNLEIWGENGYSNVAYLEKK